MFTYIVLKITVTRKKQRKKYDCLSIATAQYFDFKCKINKLINSSAFTVLVTVVTQS